MTRYSDDYATLKSGNLKFYYGYEEEDLKTDDWCFVVIEYTTEIYRLTASEIKSRDEDAMLDMPQDYLLAGIGLWLKDTVPHL